jgi:hypothetical protein
MPFFQAHEASMTYVVTWVGPHGRVRKTASTPAIALGFWTAYSRDAANFVIKDESGSRVAIDELRRMAEAS